MFNAQRPTEKDLPTSAQLLKSTVIAIIVAIILLVMVILPVSAQGLLQALLCIRKGSFF